MRTVFEDIAKQVPNISITNRWLETKLYCVIKLFGNNYQFGLNVKIILCDKINAKGSTWVDKFVNCYLSNLVGCCECWKFSPGPFYVLRLILGARKRRVQVVFKLGRERWRPNWLPWQKLKLLRPWRLRNKVQIECEGGCAKKLGEIAL